MNSPAPTIRAQSVFTDLGGGRRRRGFTLVEAVVALLLVSVVAALLLPIWVSGVRGTVAGSARLQSTLALRAEMEAFVQQARSVPFNDVPATATAHFGAIAGVDLIENEWVEFLDQGGNTFTEAPSAVVSDNLRITVRDNSTGLQVTRIFSRTSS